MRRIVSASSRNMVKAALQMCVCMSELASPLLRWMQYAHHEADLPLNSLIIARDELLELLVADLERATHSIANNIHARIFSSHLVSIQHWMMRRCPILSGRDVERLR